jgi:hypothetical protein
MQAPRAHHAKPPPPLPTHTLTHTHSPTHTHTHTHTHTRLTSTLTVRPNLLRERVKKSFASQPGSRHDSRRGEGPGVSIRCHAKPSSDPAKGNVNTHKGTHARHIVKQRKTLSLTVSPADASSLHRLGKPTTSDNAAGTVVTEWR